MTNGIECVGRPFDQCRIGDDEHGVGQDLTVGTVESSDRCQVKGDQCRKAGQIEGIGMLPFQLVEVALLAHRSRCSAQRLRSGERSVRHAPKLNLHGNEGVVVQPPDRCKTRSHGHSCSDDVRRCGDREQHPLSVSYPYECPLSFCYPMWVVCDVEDNDP